jgi:hypothetical protein
MTAFDRKAWAAACDSFFEATERNARIADAWRTLAELLPDNDDYPEWQTRRAVQS